MFNNQFQRVFITVPLGRLNTSTLTSVKAGVRWCLGFLEQTNYLRLLWIFECVSSAKDITSNFWSASPNANNSNNAWQLNFNNGNDNNNNRNNANRVRLVRSGV